MLLEHSNHITNLRGSADDQGVSLSLNEYEVLQQDQFGSTTSGSLKSPNPNKKHYHKDLKITTHWKNLVGGLNQPI